jgi:enamine deaminase RidA (YjgF/YER057c/UK114 family)
MCRLTVLVVTACLLTVACTQPTCPPPPQAVAHRGLVYMAGSIPLQPSSMAVVSGDAGAQALRALANAQAVAVAMKACCLKAAVGMVVYWASVAGQAGKVCAR